MTHLKQQKIIWFLLAPFSRGCNTVHRYDFYYIYRPTVGEWRTIAYIEQTN